MKVRTGGRTIDIADERVRGSVREHGTVHATHAGTRAARQGVVVGTGQPKKTTEAPSPIPGWPDPNKNRREKWNYSFAQFLESEKLAGRIKHWWYEPSSFWLPGEVRFKPDFLIQYPDGLEKKLHYVEVKGWSRNLRDGITRYKIAAALFPCFTWSMVKRKGSGWEEYKS